MDSTVILSVPKKYMKELNNIGQWIHGVLIEKINPYVTKGDVESHFEKWGVVIFCEVKMECTTGFPRGLGYVGFASEEQADAAQAAGPHKLAGMEVDIRRVISPKTWNMTYIPHRRNSLEETKTYARYVTHRRATLETSGGLRYRTHRRSDVGVDYRSSVVTEGAHRSMEHMCPTEASRRNGYEGPS